MKPTIVFAAAGLAISSVAFARPHYVYFFPNQVEHFSRASGEAMASTRTISGPRCVCAPGWIGGDSTVRAMMVEGPSAGTVFDLAGAPPMLAGAKVKGHAGGAGGGAGGLIAYKAVGPAGPTVAVVGPIAGPGVPPTVAFVTGLNVDPQLLEYDFDFTPDGSLIVVVAQRNGPLKRYNLFDCFPTTWSAAPLATTSNVQCETIVCKMGRVELALRGAPATDDVIVIAGPKTGSPGMVQVAAVMRSSPQQFTVLDVPGDLNTLSVADGRTYLGLSNVPSEPTDVMMRVMDGATPVGPDVTLRAASCCATGKRSYKPVTLSPPPPPPPPPPAPPPTDSSVPATNIPPDASRGGALGPGISIAMFDQPVVLESIRIGAIFQGKVILSYGYNLTFGFDSDETGDWRGFDLFCTVQFTDATSAVVHVIDATAGCPGDADGSLTVNFSDVTATLAAWGATEDPAEPIPVRGDGNYDGVVSFADITTTLANFGDDCR